MNATAGIAFRDSGSSEAAVTLNVTAADVQQQLLAQQLTTAHTSLTHQLD